MAKRQTRRSISVRGVTYQQLRATQRYQPIGGDLVLLYPPDDLEEIYTLPSTAAVRLHFLFGDREVSLQHRREQRYQVDRPRIENIWRELRKRSQQGFVPVDQIQDLKKQFALPTSEFSPALVEITVAVLSEIGWCQSSDSGLTLMKSGGRSLEDSKTFALYRQRQESRKRVFEFFQQAQLQVSLK